MAKKLDINVYESVTGVYQSMVFEVNGEKHKVSRTSFNRCCHDLGIRTTQGIINNFELVCDWYIREEQYIKYEEFEEVK